MGVLDEFPTWFSDFISYFRAVMPWHVIFFLGLALGSLPFIRRRRRERRRADEIIHSVTPEQIMENFDLLNRRGVPEQVVSLMTTKEIMEILEREPKYEVVIDARPENIRK